MIRIISVISLCLVALQSHGESLENWLRSLPQVTNVTCSYVSNDSCVLIHVKQVHKEPIVRKEDTAYIPLIATVRDDIVAIGTNLQTRLNLSAYYVEGYTAKSGDVPLLLHEQRYLYNLHKTLAKDGITDPSVDSYGLDTSTITESLYLAVTSGMEPRLTEDAVTLARGFAEISKFQGAWGTNVPSSEWAEWHRLVITDREHETLRIIAHDYTSGAVTNHYSLIIFGGAHDFRESIGAWNATNSFKFSLITVTPKSYQ